MLALALLYFSYSVISTILLTLLSMMLWYTIPWLVSITYSVLCSVLGAGYQVLCALPDLMCDVGEFIAETADTMSDEWDFSSWFSFS